LRRCTVFVFKIWLLHRLTTPKTYDLHRLRKVACIQLRALEVLVVLHLPLEILSRQQHHRWSHPLHLHRRDAHLPIPGSFVNLLFLVFDPKHISLNLERRV
jgi:hypothetical protein